MPTLTASNQTTLFVATTDLPNAKPASNALQSMFESKAAEVGNAVAVSFPEQGKNAQITYRELNERANQLAHYLQEKGVGPDVIVGVSLERSIDLIVALIAVIKAGGAYVPLDPHYPKDRLTFMIEDADAGIIITQQKIAHTLPKNSAQLLCLDRDGNLFANESKKNPTNFSGPENLAYLIFTSGSTGRPKGVAMPQRPLVNLLRWQFENWSARSEANTLQFASLNFDVSFQEILATLCSGGTLTLVSESLRRDPVALLHLLENEKVERLFLPFVALKHLTEAAARENLYPSHLAEIITAGEQLQVTHQVVNFFNHLPACTLHNQYGPSETHVVTAYQMEGAPGTWPALPPIGKPISGARIYLLNEQLKKVPQGTEGELYIAGECLAHGYQNAPELTAQKFVPNPLGLTGRFYKTGDLARELPDGNIEFLGRADDQVKIRGFRIELGELETILAEHPSVSEAVVVARSAEAGEKLLVAYLVPKANCQISAKDLRTYLASKLPPHAMPARFVTLASLPLSPSGKVNRRALPEPPQDEEVSTDSFKPPQTPLQMQLQLVFERFLKRRPIGIDASFFEMGGDSLQALGLIVEIERFTGKRLPLGILYEASTIEALAKVLERTSDDFKFSSLVTLQPLGTKPPLFLVHTTPGDVLAYGGLIYHLGLDQPCYGFQSLGFGNKEDSHTRVEEMAAFYVRHLRTIQPHGPYHLGGWCYGGIVAVEMGHQLIAAGEKVAFMGLIETPAPAPPLSQISYYFRRIGCLLKMSPRQWRTYLGQKVKYYRGVKTEDERRFRRVEHTEAPAKTDEINRHLAQLEHVYHTNLTALNNYFVRPYPGKVVLFNAEEQDPALVVDHLYGWPGLAREIEVNTISGNHDTILMEPHAKSLAQKFAEYLFRAQNN